MTWKHFPHYWPIVKGIHHLEFDVFFVVSLNMLLNKQSSCWWFEMPWHSCNITVMTGFLFALKMNNVKKIQLGGIHPDLLAPGRLGCDLKMQFSIFLYWFVSSDILMIMSPDEWQVLTDNKSTLVQIMAWCHQAPCHYLSQCWHIFVLP